MAAIGRFFLWRWAILNLNVKVGDIPCLLFSDNIEDCELGAYRLPQNLSLPTLSTYIIDALIKPSLFIRPPSRVFKLTERQLHILERTLAGDSISRIADRLAIGKGAVFASRTALIQKMGLRNRLELMSLAGKFFE